MAGRLAIVLPVHLVRAGRELIRCCTGQELGFRNGSVSTFEERS